MKAALAMVLMVALALNVFAEDEENTKKIFNEADINGDGFLTYEEALKSGAPISRERFDRFDTNKDGKLSLEETSQLIQ